MNTEIRVGKQGNLILRYSSTKHLELPDPVHKILETYYLDNKTDYYSFEEFIDSLNEELI